MPKDQCELPDNLRAGDTIIYHLGKAWKAGDNPHRVGVVASVYKDRKSVCADLTIFLAGSDGDNRDAILSITDAEYDPECPPGTFCLTTDGASDELPSAGDLQQELDEEEADREKKRQERDAVKASSGEQDAAPDDEPEDDGSDSGSESANDRPTPEDVADGKTTKNPEPADSNPAASNSPTTTSRKKTSDTDNVIGDIDKSGTERKAELEGKTPAQVRKDTPDFSKPAENTKG